MKAERKQELIHLILMAMRTVEVKANNNVIPIPQYVAFCKDKTLNSIFQFYSRLLPDILDASDKSKLVDFIRTELSSYVHNDRIALAVTTIHGWSTGFDLGELARSLLRTHLLHGYEKTVDIFEASIEADSISFQQMIVLMGITIEHEIEIFDGIRLIPLPSSTSALPHYLPIDNFSLTSRNFIAKTLMLIDKSISPVFCKPDNASFHDSFREKVKNRDIVYFNVANFCAALSLTCNHPIGPSITWNYVGEDEFFVHVNNTGHTRFDNDDIWDIPVTANQIINAKILLSNLFNLNPGVREILNVALHRWLASKKMKSPIDQIIDLGIAFESLYLEDNQRETSNTLSIRVAWYLGENIEERKKLMIEFKEIYRWRSSSVHKGKLPEKMKGVNPMEFINRAQDLCRMSILKIIKEGNFPDWNRLIMGADHDPKQVN